MTERRRKTANSSDSLFRTGLLPSGQGTALSMLEAFESQLGFWRRSGDLAREAIRAQQDQILRFWHGQFAHHTPPNSDTLTIAPWMQLNPLMTMVQATEQMLQTARDAGRSETATEPSH